MKNSKELHSVFETLLKVKGISKKAFARYSGIPYDTVAGWKKSGYVPQYAIVLLHQMPFLKEVISAEELLAAGFPRAVLWNNDPKKKVPVDIFIVATLQRAYNDFVIESLVSFFGRERVLSALLKYRDRVSNRLIEQVTSYLYNSSSVAYDKSSNQSVA